MLGKLFDSNEKQLNKLRPLVEEINRLEEEMVKLKAGDFGKRTAEFKEAVLKPGGLEKVLPEAFAMAKEATRRVQGIRLHDVQLLAALALHLGMVAEQKTGEGKTNTAVLPLYLNSLLGRGCHLVTPNDYLSRHGCGWMGPIYHFLGVSCAVIVHEEAFVFDPDFVGTRFEDEYAKHLKPISRLEAYQAEITYGTNNEFGFDYLRDNMARSSQGLVQNNSQGELGAHHYAIVDEVDSILIDEARTPLIISGLGEESTQKYYQFADLAGKLTAKTDYEVDEKDRSAVLTELGIRKIERMLGVDNLYESDFETIHHVENALKARTLYQKNKHYIVKDDHVIIVDEFTGRLMPGRRWSEGMHQAVEAKERVTIQRESKTLATISFQNYFRLYEKLAGMTGTAVTEAEEFAKIYGLETAAIPTNKPIIRIDHSDVVYKTRTAKYRAVVNEIEKAWQRGQPVLVGTTSIENNELLVSLLQRKKVLHQVLNAKHHEKEALIIAQAGRRGAVTIATNMAGRGVDIILGGDPPDPKEQAEVLKLGGLYVIGTERHESRRIDNQLRGRSGRQGDPGTSKFFVSLQDDLMRIFGGAQVERIMDRMGMDEDIPLEAKLVSKAIETSQKRVEGYNFDLRKRVVEYDDVMNLHRESIYKIRRRILLSSSSVDPALGEESNEDFKEWFLTKIKPAAGEEAASLWGEREKSLGEVWRQIIPALSLPVVDFLWMEHLTAMDGLREGVGLRSYGRKDPLVEYKNEGRQLFIRLAENIWATIAERITKVEITAGQVPKERTSPRPQQVIMKHESPELGVRDEARQIRQATIRRAGKKVGRNDPCPCGKVDEKTGKPVKYKKCCGKDG